MFELQGRLDVSQVILKSSDVRIAGFQACLAVVEASVSSKLQLPLPIALHALGLFGPHSCLLARREAELTELHWQIDRVTRSIRAHGVTRAQRLLDVLVPILYRFVSIVMYPHNLHL